MGRSNCPCNSQWPHEQWPRLWHDDNQRKQHNHRKGESKHGPSAVHGACSGANATGGQHPGTKQCGSGEDRCQGDFAREQQSNHRCAEQNGQRH